MTDTTPEYEAARLKACREIEADWFREDGRTGEAEGTIEGLNDDLCDQHFAAFDAGHAHAVAEIVGSVRELAEAICDYRDRNSGDDPRDTVVVMECHAQAILDAILRGDYAAPLASEGDAS